MRLSALVLDPLGGADVFYIEQAARLDVDYGNASAGKIFIDVRRWRCYWGSVLTITSGTTFPGLAVASGKSWCLTHARRAPSAASVVLAVS
jgi:hypothetical protein